MKKKNALLLTSITLLLCATEVLFAQVGKISGNVVDAETGEPLPGANVQIEGTTRGAATSADGSFFIINVPPGQYDLTTKYIGYNDYRVQNVRVSINRTAEVNIRMTVQVIEGETVVVEADKFTLKKDQTSSVRNVSSEQMEILPVESVSAVVSLQAGVVQGHFRGGRLGETTYLIDGLQVTDSYDGQGQTVSVEADAVQEVEVIKGTFNAEYGRAMSGIVNAVTKEGGRNYHGSISGNLANYLTPHKDIFIGLEDADIMRRQDYKFQLHGPVPGLGDRVSFFANMRYQDNKNEHNGIRLFLPTDRSFFNSPDPSQWWSFKSGDSSYVAMGWDITSNFHGKLTARVTNNIKLNTQYIYNAGEGQGYSHFYKYKPDGRSTWHSQSHLVAAILNHMLSPAIFYEAKVSYTYGDNGSYVFENPKDPGYIPDFYDSDGTGPGFSFGGMDRGHTLRVQEDLNAKLDLTWQVHKNHSIKTGVDYVGTRIDQKGRTIRNKWAGTDFEYDLYEPTVLPDSTVYSDIYDKKPIELALYLQDKMEFDEMVINFGVRYDYFDPRTTYPSNRRNPVNLIELDDPIYMSTLLDADPKSQLSPRLGLSYQLGKTALLRFAYGHFFQRPPYQNFYQNNSLIVAPRNFETRQGNPELKPEKTVQYEIGLWQQLMPGMGLEVALFYKDIYNLRSMAVIQTYNEDIYGLYTNLDYGNSKGLEVTYDFEISKVYANINYTLQYTRGNADNPSTTFDRAGNNMDPIPRLIPMSWDQRHTLNASVAYRTRPFGLSLTGRYGSGTPYTLSPLPESTLSRVLLYPNNAAMPSTYSFDLYGYYNLPVFGNMNLKFELYIYNLLDKLNENGVYGRTGRAYTNIILDQERANHRSDFNDIEDRYENPAMYSSPRLVKLGVGLEF